MSTLRRMVMSGARDIAYRLGLSVERVSSYTCPFVRTASLCRILGTTLVLDVGANEGQYAVRLRRAGYSGRIASFEPLTAAYHRLSAAARRDGRWIVPPRMAIGATTGSADLNVAGNSVSSSLRPMTATHVLAEASSQIVAVESVPVMRLDEAYESFRVPGDSGIFLKLDVQGHEDQVLAGASSLIASIDAIQMEMSFVELYEGQSLFFEQAAAIRGRGYEIWSIDRGFMNGDTGRLLQCDVTFVRTSAIAGT